MPPPYRNRAHFNSASHKLDSKEFKINAEIKIDPFEVMAAVGLRADTIAVGDTNHTSLAVKDFLHGEKFSKSLAEAGCKHVCVEHLIESDSDFKKVHAGTMSRKDFIDSHSDIIWRNDGQVTKDYAYNQMFDQALYCKKYGMDIHAVDTSPATHIEINMYNDRLDYFETNMMIYDAIVQEKIGALYARDTGEKISDLEMDSEEYRNVVTHYLPQLDESGQQVLSVYLSLTLSVESWDTTAGHNKILQLNAALYDDLLQRTVGEMFERDTGEKFEEFKDDLQKKRNIIDQYQRQISPNDRKSLNTLARATDEVYECRDKWDKHRLNDKGMAEVVRVKTDGEKAAIIYGAAHDDLVDRFDGWRGQKNVLVFEAYENAEAMHEWNVKRGNYETSKGQPDIVYLVEENKVLVTDHGMQKGWVRDAIKEMEHKGVGVNEYPKPMDTQDLAAPKEDLERALPVQENNAGLVLPN